MWNYENTPDIGTVVAKHTFGLFFYIFLFICLGIAFTITITPPNFIFVGRLNISA